MHSGLHDRTVSRFAVLTLVAALAAACSGTSSPSPSAPAATSPATSPSSSTGASSAPSSTSAADALAALKAKVQGKTVTIGTSTLGNVSLVGTYKMIDFLKSDFGVNVDIKTLDSDPLVAAMIAGQVQVGQLSLAGVANADSAGAPFKVFAADDQKNVFVVAAKNPITSIDQVKGKPFAVTQNLSQITGQTATQCLKEAGLDIQKDVQLLKLSNTGDTTTAIQSGQVAAGISATFRLTKLQLQSPNTYNILCKGWEANPSIGDTWFATNDWLSANPDLALAITVAEIEGARWTKANRDAWIQYATANVSGETAEAAAIDYDTLVGQLDDWPVNGSLDRTLCDQTLATSWDFKAITKQYTTDDLVTFDFQNQALQLLGTQ